MNKKKIVYIYNRQYTNTYDHSPAKKKYINLNIKEKRKKKTSLLRGRRKSLCDIYINNNGTVFEIGQGEYLFDLEKSKWFFNICLFPIG